MDRKIDVLICQEFMRESIRQIMGRQSNNDGTDGSQAKENLTILTYYRPVQETRIKFGVGFHLGSYWVLEKTVREKWGRQWSWGQKYEILKKQRPSEM